MTYRPYDYQREAERWIMAHERCCLFLDMGLGKTVITLTAILRLMDDGDIERALVIAPRKVAESTWAQEAAKWAHLRSLRVGRAIGDAKARKAALDADNDVCVIGRDTLPWLLAQYAGRPFPFDCLVLDELSSFKNHRSKRFKAARLMSASVCRTIGLTGTPAPNGLIDLWAELACVDLGERLGRFYGKYRDAYFSVVMRNNIPVRVTARPGADAAIREKLSDICLSMSARGRVELPPLVVRTEYVDLPGPIMARYREFERDRVLEAVEASRGASASVIAANAAALMTKLAQFAGGAVYTEGLESVRVHDEKLERLVELVEAAQSPVLVFYEYRHEVPRMAKALQGYRVAEFDGQAQLDLWNAGKLDVLLAHPASTAFGLNMQAGGHYVVWYGLTWNLELYQQANARLHRQGQRHTVFVYRLLCRGTVDERVAAALERKDGTQRALLRALDSLAAKYSRKIHCDDETFS